MFSSHVWLATGGYLKTSIPSGIRSGPVQQQAARWSPRERWQFIEDGNFRPAFSANLKWLQNREKIPWKRFDVPLQLKLILVPSCGELAPPSWDGIPAKFGCDSAMKNSGDAGIIPCLEKWWAIWAIGTVQKNEEKETQQFLVCFPRVHGTLLLIWTRKQKDHWN